MINKNSKTEILEKSEILPNDKTLEEKEELKKESSSNLNDIDKKCSTSDANNTSENANLETAIDDKLKSVITTTAIGMTIFIISDIFFKVASLGIYTFDLHIARFTMLFGIVIYTLLFAITKKASRATAIGYITIFIMNLINQVKMIYTNEPLYFSDVKFLTNLPGLLELATGNISFKLVSILIIIFGIYALILIGLTYLSKKNDIEFQNKKGRIIVIIIDIIILLILFLPNNFTKEFFLKVFYNTENYADYNSYVTNLDYYARKGLIGGMYGVHLNNTFTEPDGFNDEELNKLLNEVEDTKESNLGKPNIVIFFSESFWDIDKVTEIEFNKQVVPNFNKLKSEGKFVNILSPAYGGMSENVAFELLTTASMNYFPKGYIPIMTYYSRKNSSSSTSLVKVLKDNGYSSEIIFGNDDYHCKKGYLSMGFDEYTDLDDGEITDKELTNILEDRLLENKGGNPELYVVETREAHMPYPKDKFDKYDIKILNSNLTDSENDTIRSYAQAIHNADKELYNLYEYLKDYEEPTILLFLGDHLPYLYTADQVNAMGKLQYFNTDDVLLNNYRIYNTQGLILSNYDTSTLEMPDYIGTDLLLNHIINQLDVKTNDYYKWVDLSLEVYSASNRYVTLDKNGNIYDTQELENEMQKMYNLRYLMWYKFFIK